ncbi:multicopper oxidase family protein [Streptomyces sp. NBC_00207]|uniref:multicopper oxidase family protein n=1 Tax=Streptomyces sp. NBC_00207 TaxID=2903635 RepID=UPI0032440779
MTFDGAKLDHGHKLMRNVGFLGDRTMVNGTLDPYATVQDELVRLRLLNASTARVYTFGFDDGRAFRQIASDGGLLEAPHTTSRLRLSPGERAEIVIRMQPGERRILRSHPLDAGLDFWNQRFGGGDDSFDVMQLRAAPTLRPSAELPGALVASALPTGEDPSRSRFFELKMSGINGRKMDMSRVDETVTRGTTETWTLRNDDGMPHNFHVHDVQFRILEINGAAPPPPLRGPKDTVFVLIEEGGETRRETLRFEGRLVELFVHTRAGLDGLFAADAASRRGTMQHMYAGGLVLSERDGAAANIKRHAEEALRKGPGALAPATVESRRYVLTDALDDLADTADVVERLAVAGVVLNTAADLLFDHRRAWTGGGKWLPRRLLQTDPRHGGALLDGHRRLCGDGEPQDLADAAAEVLTLVGGPLREGYARTWRAAAEPRSGQHT